MECIQNIKKRTTSTKTPVSIIYDCHKYKLTGTVKFNEIPQQLPENGEHQVRQRHIYG